MKLTELQNLYSQTSITKFDDVIKSPFPTMFDLTEKYGPEVTKVWIFEQLSDYATFVNAGKSFSKEQLNQTADLIMMAYSNLHMTDFKLFFNKCKLGHYGKIFDVLDGQILLGWLLEYKNERINAAEHISIKQAAEFKQLEKEPVNLTTSQEYIDAIKALLSENKPAVNNLYQNGKIVEQREAKPRNLATDQVWMRQFNNLARGNKFRKYQIESPIRMIQVGNLKQMSITEYLEYKIKSIK